MTILDEIAHRSFDTPSKVALHLSDTIRDSALAAITSLDRISLQVARILARERTALSTQAERVEAGLRSVSRQAQDDLPKFMTVIRTATHFQLREAGQALEAGYVRFIGTAEQTLCDAELKLKRSMQTISHRSELVLAEQQAAIDQAANVVVLQATSKVDSASRDLEYLKAQLDRDSTRLVTKADEDLGCDFDAITQGAKSIIETARREIESSTRVVVGLGPQATLRRGFAIVRGLEGQPVTSRESALGSPELLVQFRDGTVPVVIREIKEGLADE